MCRGILSTPPLTDFSFNAIAFYLGVAGQSDFVDPTLASC